MAVKLNLLPPELAVDKNLSTVLKLIRSLGIIAIAMFIVFVVVCASVFYVSTVSLKKMTSDVSKATNQVKASETSEQQMILLKDRIAKIGTIQKLPSGLKNLVAIEPYLNSLLPDSSLNELDVDSKKVQILLTFRSNSDLSSFMSNLSKSEAFKNVILSSFSLSPVSGYSVGINIEGK